MTDVEKVRLLIGDNTAPYQFTDSEIEAFLDMASDSLLLAASYALEAWAAAVTDSYNSERMGDYQYTKKDAENKMALAKKYKEENDAVPYMTWSEMELDEVGSTTEESE